MILRVLLTALIILIETASAQTSVTLDLVLTRLSNIDMAGSFNVAGHLRAKWFARRAPATRIDCSTLTFNPDLYFLSTLQDQIDTAARCSVDANQFETIETLFSTTISQEFELKEFPVDKHIILVSIMSRYPASQVSLFLNSATMLPGAFSFYEWNNGTFSNRVYNTSSLFFGTSHAVAELSIEIDRDTDLYLFQTCIPTILLTVIPWLTLFLPYDSTASRMVTSAVALLSVLTLRAAISQNLPRSSATTWIDIGFILCILQIFLSFVWNIIIVNLWRHKNPLAKNISVIAKLMQPLLSATFAGGMLTLFVSPLVLIGVIPFTLVVLFFIHRRTLQKIFGIQDVVFVEDGDDLTGEISSKKRNVISPTPLSPSGGEPPPEFPSDLKNLELKNMKSKRRGGGSTQSYPRKDHVTAGLTMV